MNESAHTQTSIPAHLEKFSQLRHAIEHASHLLPAQGPITVFVHHNTLHAFENLPFEKGVVDGGRTFGCHPFLSEDRYRKKFDHDRIRVKDIEAVLLHDLGENADMLIGRFGTRYALRLAMLQFPFHSGPVSELRWFIAETDALRRFRQEVKPAVREQTITQTRHWIMRDFLNGNDRHKPEAQHILENLFCQFGKETIEMWDDSKWEAFVLHFLWRVCFKGAQSARVKSQFTQHLL
ncbi:MAG: DUF2309 family protein, partial [Planctomycetaceae bacterium]|nr:DUF2309 family protein [Planctomycetaceae bacterium]